MQEIPRPFPGQRHFLFSFTASEFDNNFQLSVKKYVLAGFLTNLVYMGYTRDKFFTAKRYIGIAFRWRKHMKTNESAENYLETILILSKKLPVVRSVDIATELGYKKPSVSIAMKNLKEKKYITIMEQGYIFLTESGREIAEMIYERHEFFTGWLISLGVDAKIAAQDACRIEHVVSKESFEAIKKNCAF